MENEKNVDFDFLRQKIEDKSVVDVYLVNGVKLNGVIFDQDDVSLVMSGKNDKKDQLVYKKNISTVT